MLLYTKNGYVSCMQKSSLMHERSTLYEGSLLDERSTLYEGSLLDEKTFARVEIFTYYFF